MGRFGKKIAGALVALHLIAFAPLDLPRVPFVIASVEAAGLSDVQEQADLERIFKQTAPTAITLLYVSLHGTSPGDTCANEISGGSYARAQLNPDTNASTHTNWNSSVAGAGTAQRITNKLAITFPTATATWFGGAQIPYFCLMGHATASTPCYGCGSFTGGGPVVTNTVTLNLPGGTPGIIFFDSD